MHRYLLLLIIGLTGWAGIVGAQFTDFFVADDMSSSYNNNDCLVTDGSGVLSWTSSCGGGGGGSTLHVDGGGFVYPQTGDFHSAPYYTATGTTESTFPNASTTLLTFTTAWGDVVGNADTATALAANGANCSSGNAPLGVDASGAVESCFDVWTEAENTSAAYAPQSRNLTVAGTALDITSSAGAQSLASDRTWTLSYARTAAIGSNPALSASNATFGSTGIVFEGSAADTIEGLLTWPSITSTDKTITLPNITGTVALLEGTQTFSGVKTISSNWVNTANPWADNEVADTLTIGAGSTIADDLIVEADLSVTNSGTDNYVLSFNSAGSNFTWVEDATGDGIATTSDIVGLDGTAEDVGYFSDDFMIGGSSSTTAEFQFDPEGAQFIIASSAAATSTITDDSGNDAIRLMESDGEGIEWDFGTAGDVILTGLSSVAEFVSSLNFTFTGIMDFTSATVNFGADAIDALTEIAAALKSGSDATLVTGTAGTDQNLIEWDANGDAIDSGVATTDVFTETEYIASTTNPYITTMTNLVTVGTITSGTWTGTDIAVADGGTGASDAGTARTNLGLAIGTNVQAWDADLDTYAGITPSANVQSLLDAADYTAFVALLEATIETALDSLLSLTEVAISTVLQIPEGASPTVDASGEIAIDTTSGQLIFHDGTNKHVLTGTTSPAFNIASTTLDAAGNSFSAGTTTPLLYNAPEAFTLIGWYCKARDAGSALVRFGDGTNFTNEATCNTTGGFTEATSNNTFTQWEDFEVEIGEQATDPDRLTITLVINKTAD